VGGITVIKKYISIFIPIVLIVPIKSVYTLKTKLGQDA